MENLFERLSPNYWLNTPDAFTEEDYNFPYVIATYTNIKKTDYSAKLLKLFCKKYNVAKNYLPKSILDAKLTKYDLADLEKQSQVAQQILNNAKLFPLFESYEAAPRKYIYCSASLSEAPKFVIMPTISEVNEKVYIVRLLHSVTIPRRETLLKNPDLALKQAQDCAKKQVENLFSPLINKTMTEDYYTGDISKLFQEKPDKLEIIRYNKDKPLLTNYSESIKKMLIKEKRIKC